MTPPKFANVLAPKPFAVPIPKKATKKKGKWQTAVVYGDRHGIVGSPTATNILYSVIEDVKPSTIINVGDDVDCYAISSFDKNPNRIHTLQDEVDNTREHLHKVSQLAPDAYKVWLEGNHEDRLRRIIWRLPGASQELAKLKVVREALTWPALVGTRDIGWEFVETADQAKTSIIPKLITKHGTKIAGSSAFTAKMEMGKYGKSGLSGHSHRLGRYYHRDLNGTHVWCETGCLCSIDPEYDTDPDWQQGFVVVNFANDSSWFNIEEVYIENGFARYREHSYKA